MLDLLLLVVIVGAIIKILVFIVKSFFYDFQEEEPDELEERAIQIIREYGRKKINL